MTPLKVLNVNNSLDLKTGGGTAERTFQMSRFIGYLGAKCVVLTLDIELDGARVAAMRPAQVVALRCIWKRFHIPVFKFGVIFRLVKEADVVHLMGHWSVINAMAYFACRCLGRPYVVCPAGALPLFGRSRRFKQLYNFLVGFAIVRNAEAWIAVTAAELPQFESYGISSAKVTIIPNGVSKKDFRVADKRSLSDRFGWRDGPIVLFMGRLNSIKGPDLLLEAFIKLSRHIPNIQLVFAGPDGGLLSDLRLVVAEQGLDNRVHFLGHVEGDDKVMLYRQAALLVVPSRQEAMSIVALEAGICGTPVLLTDQCGFGDVRSVDPRLEVSANATAIANGIAALFVDPETLMNIAPIWEKFVVDHFSWESLAPRYLALYSGIHARKARA